MTVGPFNGTLLGSGWGVGTVTPGITGIAGELGRVQNPDGRIQTEMGRRTVGPTSTARQHGERSFLSGGE